MVADVDIEIEADDIVNRYSLIAVNGDLALTADMIDNTGRDLIETSPDVWSTPRRKGSNHSITTFWDTAYGSYPIVFFENVVLMHNDQIFLA